MHRWKSPTCRGCQLQDWLVDCQVHTEHLERFGAHEVSRANYLDMLRTALDEPTKRGKWTIEIDQAALAAARGGTEADAT